MTSLLRLTNVRKSFAGAQALKGVSFELKAGEIHALVGENGAGKSTLIKIITGAHRADEGSLEINGDIVAENDPQLARSRGVAVIYQRPALLPDLTVAENIALGLEPRGAWRMVRWSNRRKRARELLARAGASIDSDALVRSLSMPEQQLVEIARALGANARILILDEPTASLSEREVERLHQVLRELRGQGVGIIYISHRLEELTALADRVTVLRDGSSIATKSMGDVDRAELIRLMVGREISVIFPKQTVPLGKTVLAVSQLGCRSTGVHDVNFAVRSGEIVALAGLVGAGRTEVARILFGLTPAEVGEIHWQGRPISINSPTAAMRLGIGYVPEDRRRYGVIPEMSIVSNTSLAVLDQISSRGFIRFRLERALAAEYAAQLRTKAASVHMPVADLSGGNQQKVAMARWLATKPKLLILDEPTQGIDVGAKAEIHRLMGELAAEGMAILMISSELPEVLGMSDRVVVMHGGTVAGILDRAEATQESILALALGHPRAARSA
jgi:rhamnose transport system ATP-binding protein